MDYFKILEGLPKVLGAIPTTVEAAVKSPLAIFALILVGICGLTLIMFRKLHISVRFAMFLLLLTGVAVFGVSVVRVETKRTSAKAYMRAAAAYNSGQATEALGYLNAAIATVSDHGSGLTTKEVEGWRYYLLTIRSLWAAFAEDNRTPGFEERTALHLRDAFIYWARVPEGALPNDFITAARVQKVTNYLCGDGQTARYVRSEDSALRTQACSGKVAATAPPIGAPTPRVLIARPRLNPPPSERPATQEDTKVYEKEHKIQKTKESEGASGARL